MLDASTLTRFLINHTPFIMSRGVRVGFKGDELLDFTQETALQLWRNRASWPAEVQSELGLIRKHADATAIDMMRARTAQKRGSPATSLTRDDVADLANTKFGAALRVAPVQDEIFDIRLIRHAIRVVAATLSPELERIVIARLKNDGGDDYSKNENQRALRAFRRALDIPTENPQGAGVSDSADHLIRTAQRIEAAANAAGRRTIDTTQEITCASDIWTNSRESGSLRSQEHLAMSGREPSSSRSLWSATAAAINTSRSYESTPAPRSLPPQSGSGYSRRPAPSGSIGTTTSAQRSARRPEPTLVTRHQMFEDDSSISGSRG